MLSHTTPTGQQNLDSFLRLTAISADALIRRRTLELHKTIVMTEIGRCVFRFRVYRPVSHIGDGRTSGKHPTTRHTHTHTIRNAVKRRVYTERIMCFILNGV